MQNKQSQLKTEFSSPLIVDVNLQEKSVRSIVTEQQRINEINKNQKSKKQPHSFQKQQQQIKNTVSLNNISIQSPIRKSQSKTQQKSTQKVCFSQNTISEKIQVKKPNIYNPIHQSIIKSTVKNGNKAKEVNKPFYEETYYISGMKQNYLLLLSDSNQVLQFPVGMFTTQNNQNQEEYVGSPKFNESTEKSHLIKDIKIGQPIKIKLELDFFRQQKDEQLFNSLQKRIHQEYSQEPNEYSQEPKEYPQESTWKKDSKNK